ncbi:MAG: monovalent cation/H+ antiporter complex subunit F [Methylacidiphilales bacterium]|nr:monovalent cation/H+ antiporter complex subunit F [Candidatus Methylacidiphilales bacterium]MDW8349578.1 monovalent cation/H+ antiporter complex subunit F [Verrucomicrobiae bacterium]
MPTTLFFLLMTLFGIGLILAVLRLSLGPILADRVVALDLIGIIVAGMLCLYGVYHQNAVYLDIVVVIAMILFFSTVAFAAYIEKQKTTDKEH